MQETVMADQWTIRGKEFASCNCDWGCPCQFGANSTYGKCEAVASGVFEDGNFNDISLNGLRWINIFKWPGEIADGNGAHQCIIDERADNDQREAMRKILHGESTAPGATHFFVFNSTMSTIHEPLFKAIELDIDVDARTAHINVDGLVESKGVPIIDAFSGEPSRSLIHLPNGFEYTEAEMGNGSSTITTTINMEFSDSYGQFNTLHMNQDGVIR
jgi:hypothetical protein